MDIHKPYDFQLLCERVCRAADFVEDIFLQRVRRNYHRRIARMDARILNVFEHSADYCRFAVAYGVNIKLYRVFEEFVEQHRLSGGGLKGLAHDFFHIVHSIDNKHSPSAQDERGS